MNAAPYIEMLKTKFEERKTRNARYSLRSYSRLLGLDPGSLSAILRGRRPLSRLRARQVVDRLGLTDLEKRDFYLSLMERHRSPHRLIEERSAFKLEESLHFQVISEWEYAATLCLMEIKTFKASIETLRLALRISKKRASTVIDVLLNCGLIERDELRVLRRRSINFRTAEDVSSLALRKSHTESMKLASRKMEELDVLDRDFSSITICAKSRELSAMKEMIRVFRRDFESRFESSSGDVVFNLGLQLFPLSAKLSKGGK